MYCCYFDENKVSPDSPNFWIGGVLVPEEKMETYENFLILVQKQFFTQTFLNKGSEIHGNEIFHGKGIFRKTFLTKRIKVFEDILTYTQSLKIPVRITCIKTKQGDRNNGDLYQLGISSSIQSIDNFLQKRQSLGLIFCDYEQKEMQKAILNHSRKKTTYKDINNHYKSIIDTIYYIESHSSRFMQASDLLVFLANRYDNKETSSFSKWHDKKLSKAWNLFKKNSDIKINYI